MAETTQDSLGVAVARSGSWDGKLWANGKGSGS